MYTNSLGSCDTTQVGSGIFACFGSGFGSGYQISLDPDPVFKLFWIRIRFQPGSWNKKECRKGSAKNLKL